MKTIGIWIKMTNQKEIARKIFLKCDGRAKGQQDRTFMNGCRYAIEMMLRETGDYNYFNFSEVICDTMSKD